MAKEIQLRSLDRWHDARYRNETTPWTDVWLRFKTRPGRTVHLAPCLIGLKNLLADLKDANEEARATVDREIDWEKMEREQSGERFPQIEFKDVPRTADVQQMWEETSAELAAIRSAVEEHGFHVSDKPKSTIPNIYTAAEWITRDEAERMLARYLREEYGIRNPKFRWRKS